MAKRLGDTKKWDKAWIRNLPPQLKLFWVYLLDRCDHAGIWDADLGLAEFQLGIKLDKEEILKIFGNKIIEIDDGEKWFLPRFINFQYGPFLSETNRVHLSVINLIRQAGLEQHIVIADENSTPRAMRSRLTQKKKDEIIARDEFTCQYCSNQFPKSDLTVDHITPVSKGGNNEDDNLLTACAICNSRKGEQGLTEFYQKWGESVDFTDKTMEALEALSTPLEAPCNLLQGAKDKSKSKNKSINKDNNNNNTDDEQEEFVLTSSQKRPATPKRKEILAWWNDIARKNGLPEKITMPDSLLRKFKTRAAEGFWDSRGKIAQQIQKSRFLKEDFSAFCLDWLLKNDSNWVKVVEGNYSRDNGGGNGKRRSPKPAHAMPFPS